MMIEKMTLQQKLDRDEQCKKLNLTQQIKLMAKYGYEWPPPRKEKAEGAA